MQICRHRSFEISPAFSVLVALACLLFPVKLVLAWLAAALAHELGHYLALKLYKVQIYTIYIGPLGAKIETESMETYKEILSTLAGPLGGMSMILLVRVVPLVALFAVFQSLYNLIPVYPLDGGRVLKCVFQYLSADVGGKLFRRIEFIVSMILLLLAVIISYIFKLGLIPILWFMVLMLRNKISLQRAGTNSTIVPADISFVKSREEYITDDQTAAKNSS